MPEIAAYYQRKLKKIIKEKTFFPHWAYVSIS